MVYDELTHDERLLPSHGNDTNGVSGRPAVLRDSNLRFLRVEDRLIAFSLRAVELQVQQLPYQS